MDYKRKALLATEYKIENIRTQTGFFVRNIWKIIGFGIFISFWAPTHQTSAAGFKSKSALQINDYNYLDLVLMTAFGYTVCCFIGHYIWSWQDKKQLKKLIQKRNNLKKNYHFK
ncbi:hypothetical protein [Gelidibacter gilvus]|uniref:Uncharacterized protein n=1 Tax=Gelidibacter gilvus TaxID=59602 RepID=A0A4Q0XKS3_9FLAO|nr:hypothetical protein [Gelidibacter gilvus]RXJ52842.1 hypothetical protein ESZ48_03890 [Gelidibacter gilvus]